MTAPTCIDLAARYGHLYRIRYEEQASDWPIAERPWLARIACRYGYVGVQGSDRLHAFTTHRGIGARLRRLPIIERAQGDAEVRVVFHIDHLDAVLALLQPYRRRQVSEMERERLRALSAQHGFGSGRISDSEHTAPETMQATQDRKEATPT